MATFNQNNQNVNIQYNAETINFDCVKTHDDFFQKLESLITEIDRAIEEKLITKENAIEAEEHVKQVIHLAEGKTFNKKVIIEHLTTAKRLVSGVEGLVVVIASAIATLSTLF